MFIIYENYEHKMKTWLPDKRRYLQKINTN